MTAELLPRRSETGQRVSRNRFRLSSLVSSRVDARLRKSKGKEQEEEEEEERETVARESHDEWSERIRPPFFLRLTSYGGRKRDADLKGRLPFAVSRSLALSLLLRDC